MYQYITRQDNKNQTVPQSVITAGTSEVNISTITSPSNSHNQIVVAPRLTHISTPRKNRDKEASNVNVIEESMKKKQKAKDSDQECNKIKMKDTATTIGTESQIEQSFHDHKNGEDSKQNHDVQNGLEGPQLH